jgi:hypothetical protein
MTWWGREPPLFHVVHSSCLVGGWMVVRRPMVNGWWAHEFMVVRRSHGDMAMVHGHSPIVYGGWPMVLVLFLLCCLFMP